MMWNVVGDSFDSIPEVKAFLELKAATQRSPVASRTGSFRLHDPTSAEAFGPAVIINRMMMPV
jgi:hypothetical protein